MYRSVRHTLSALIVAALMLIAGCTPSGSIKEEKAEPVLELSVRVASLDLSGLGRRLTKADVSDLWALLKREKVEILTVQGLTRYPGLTTRTDLVDELTSMSGWRSAFGELVDNSGRLNGNAVFASYPIRSRATVSFHTVKGAVFEGALQTVIDGGVREIIVVSATYPGKGDEQVKNECRTLIAEARGNPDAPMILAGGNPAPRDGWDEVFGADKPVGLQYDGVGAMKLLDSKTVTAKLGTLSLATFGLYRTQ